MADKPILFNGAGHPRWPQDVNPWVVALTFEPKLCNIDEVTYDRDWETYSSFLQ